MLHLTRLRAALVVPIRFGRVVVVPRISLPRAYRLRVKRPIGDVDAAHPIDERSSLQLIWREPLARVPAPNLFTDLALADFEWQKTLRPNRCLDFLVIDE